MDSRELTRQERAAIHKLVAGMCANYDSEYGCLPLDPVLEATLTGREAPALETCAACGKPFVPEGKQTYCSPACAGAARRKRQREYMRRNRADC